VSNPNYPCSGGRFRAPDTPGRGSFYQKFVRLLKDRGMDLVEASKHYPCVKTKWVEYLGEHPDPAIDRVE
jgi:hypothetical protein